MAVAVTFNGKNYFFNYGVLSRQSKKPVTQYSLFGIGSLTKLFTATTAVYLDQAKKINLNSPISHYLTQLKNPEFNKITLINLLTHTSGLSLFTPAVSSQSQLVTYLNKWTPKDPIGTERMYSNLGYGLVGMSIQSATGSYKKSVADAILKPLKLSHTYFQTPSNKNNLAQGYNSAGKAIPFTDSTLPAASGMYSSSADLIRFVQANLQSKFSTAKSLNMALQATQKVYYKTPFLTQALGWEVYPYPLKLQTLTQGHNSELKAKASKLNTLPPANQEGYFDKTETGDQNTFASYVAFIPQQKIGIVILANKFYPFNERPVVGYKILQQILKS
ncbi:serine hydrolase [Coxiella burnetii]|uniref:serine hydrolase n=1 Tax=Coxiella burnetii TaxID=777 RepID=UPI0000ED0142|nr:serine hydrolase [Coxiella burnetii]AIT63762.1 Beta-lactamase [Coxiella burnetii str. Namibia]ATN85307.1 serine hydrolase [Coxiella burnetii str. Schperling]EAX33271.1 serine hydrolase [Coxiella burnetii 'MSU Goat Q177']EDR36423.1 beta-lactamase class C [Coxiella burnetii Q321]PHH58194.1 serine hydrolase [Coxiella burnetii]